MITVSGDPTQWDIESGTNFTQRGVESECTGPSEYPIEILWRISRENRFSLGDDTSGLPLCIQRQTSGGRPRVRPVPNESHP